jgi:FAD/FMN-containing dehydrogenase
MQEMSPICFGRCADGGGSFGVVTALEFDLLPLREIFAGALLFPAEQASEVLQGWREWTAACRGNDVSRSADELPTIPEMPERLARQIIRRARGDLLVATRQTASSWRRRYAELGTAAMDTTSDASPAGIAELHMDRRRRCPTPVSRC